jgi:hypothetical protein
MAAQLDAATKTVVVSDAVDAERFITAAWQDVVCNVRDRHPRAARRAYDRQADLIRAGIADRNPGIDSVDVLFAAPYARLRDDQLRRGNHTTPPASPLSEVSSMAEVKAG